MGSDTARIMVTPQKGLQGHRLSQRLDREHDQDAEVSIVSLRCKKEPTGQSCVDLDQA